MAQQINFGRTAADREEAFIGLYKKAFPGVARYVSRMGGSFDEAKDVFQDALLTCYEKSVAGQLNPKANIQAYLFGVARHLWLRKFQRNMQCLPLDEAEMDRCEVVDEELSARKVMRFLETAGKKCMELLKAFYYDNLAAGDIAELFGFSGERSATVQKYKCMEKVRDTVKERSLTYEDFVE